MAQRTLRDDRAEDLLCELVSVHRTGLLASAEHVVSAAGAAIQGFDPADVLQSIDENFTRLDCSLYLDHRGDGFNHEVLDPADLEHRCVVPPVDDEVDLAADLAR